MSSLLESSAWKDKTGMMEPLNATSSLAFEGGGVKVYRITK